MKRISLKPSEEATVQFTLNSRQLALIDNEGKCVLEPGEFEIFIGGNQPDTRSEKLTGKKILMTSFYVTGEPIELPY